MTNLLKNLPSVDLTNVSGTLPIANGGTGQDTAPEALNALLPDQTGNTGKVLTTDGTDPSWQTNAGGDVVGPASSTDKGVVRFSGTTGKLVQDSLNVVIDAAGMMGIGTLTPTVLLHLKGDVTTLPLFIVDSFKASGTLATNAFVGRGARGTEASPSALELNDVLAGLAGRGYGATGYLGTGLGAISIRAAENFTDVAAGVYIAFYTSAIGTVAAGSERMRISDVGAVSIGTQTAVATLTLNRSYSASAWGFNGANLRVAPSTTTDTSSSGTVTNVTGNSFGTPTFAASSSTTYTHAATVYISAAPTAGTNVTVTNALALWIDAGNARFDGMLSIGTGVAPTSTLTMGGSITAASWGNSGIGVVLGLATYTDSSSSGTVAQQVISNFALPTMAASSATTYTVAATLRIAAAPAAGTNVTITNAFALFIDAGASRFDGNVTIGGATAPTKALEVTGDVSLMAAGNGLYVKEGSNATMGVATLVAGTVTVNTTKVTANSRIFVTGQNTSGTAGFVDVSARSAGTSFTILSSNSSDTRAVAWIIFEPAA